MDKRTPKVFIIAPMRSDFDSLREDVRRGISLASEVLGKFIESVYIGGFETALDIVKAVQDEISRSDLIVAEVTAPSARLIWDLGAAQAKGKTLLLLTSNVSSLPAEMRGVRTIVYGKDIYDEEVGGTSGLVRIRVGEALTSVFGDSEGREDVPQVAKPCKIFVSYCRTDTEFLTRILVHLKPLEREGIIELWSDTKIRPGDRWKGEIRKALEAARCAILLVSADFLASDFITRHEIPPLLIAAEERGTRIIPIIVKPSLFSKYDKLAQFQTLNDPGTPVIKMTDVEREELYVKLAETIEADFSIDPNPLKLAR